eukprot:365412-Chlamydomonas_euryale.AAC.10
MLRPPQARVHACICLACPSCLPACPACLRAVPPAVLPPACPKTVRPHTARSKPHVFDAVYANAHPLAQVHAATSPTLPRLATTTLRRRSLRSSSRAARRSG